MAWSEHKLHRWLAQRPRPKGLRTPLGHDAAQIRSNPDAVICVDACVEGVHFERDTPAARVGHKAAARALSDLAACGAIPTALLLGLRAPKEATARRLQGMISALDQLGQQHGAFLVGGDLSCAPGPLGLTVTAIGHLQPGCKPVTRSGGRGGDILLITGPVGGSRAGRHLRFEPRLNEGRLLVRSGVRALMDVSDGLALDCDRLARQSQVALELTIDALPIHKDAERAAKRDGSTALSHALNDGEDHELIALLPRSKRKLLEPGEPLAGVHVIGRARNQTPVGLILCQGDSREEWSGKGGWQHGA